MINCRILALHQWYLAPVLLFIVAARAFALQPEDVLGNYWEDPLFGVASADESVQVEVLYGLIFPKVIEVDSRQRVRFHFKNNSDETHVFLFEEEGGDALSDADFRAFIDDEVAHAEMEVSSNDGHVHAHNGNDTSGTKSLVSRLSDRPTMTLKPRDSREMILMFDDADVVLLRCILEGHEDDGHESRIRVLTSGEIQ